MRKDRISLTLEVDDKGSVVVSKFSSETINKVKSMSERSSRSLLGMQRHFSKVAGVAGKLAKKIGDLGKKVAALGLKLGALGLKIAAVSASATALAGSFVLKKAIQGFAVFESALTDMGKVTKESFESIKQKVMALPSALGSATELVRGYYQVISAGVTEPKAAMETLIAAAKAAKAAHVDQSEVIKGLTKLMAGYEGEIKRVSDAADILFTIEKEGQTSVAELIPVIGGLAKISHDLGVNQNEMGASLALITQTAGSTAEAATQYQAVLMGLMKPTKEMSEALSGMGFESAQAAIQQLGLAETMRRLINYTGGSAEKMNELFGRVEAVKGVSALAANDFSLLNAKVEAMKHKTGAASGAWEKYKATLSALWETCKNTIGKQLILIGEKLAPTIKKVVETTTKWLEANRDLITAEVGAWIESIAGATKKLWPEIAAVAKQAGEWYKKNRDLIQTKLSEWIKSLSENIQFLTPIMRTLITVAKGVWTIFERVGKAIGETAAKIWLFAEKAVAKVRRAIETIRELTAAPIKLVTKFVGEGSTRRPLTEKINEMEHALAAFSRGASSTHPSVITEFVAKTPQRMSMSCACNKVKNQTEELASDINALEPELDIDISPALNALKRLRAEAEEVLANMMLGMQKNVQSLMRTAGYFEASKAADVWRREIWRTTQDYRQMIWRMENIPLAGMGNYQLGTGFVPRTGVYELHRGEQVLPPNRTQRTVNNQIAVHVYLPDGAAGPAEPEDWRLITREYILPEIEKANGNA